jgi:hypothetical protein
VSSTANSSNSAAPSESSALVRSPAVRCRNWRSRPTAAPSTSATAARPANTPAPTTGNEATSVFITVLLPG